MGTFLEKVVVMIESVSGKFQNNMNRVTDRVQRFSSASDVLTRSLKGFKIEMLGVMFFGQMLQRTFLGLLQPVMEAFGVFDLFREMLLILFIPVMEMLLDPLLELFDYITNLPDPVKKAIGVFVLIGVVFGTLLLLFGQLSLGLGALLTAFPGLGTVVAGVWKIITGIFSVAGLVIIAIIVGIIVAWKENFLNIREWISVFFEGIKNIFKGVFQVLGGIIDLFVNIIKGDFEGVKDAVVRIFKGLGTIVWGVIQAIVGAVMTVGIGIIRVFKGIIDTIIGFFKWLWNVLVGNSIIPDIVNAIIDWFWRIPSDVVNMLKSLVSKAYNFGKDFVGAIIDGIKSVGSKIKDTVSGFLGGVGNIGSSIANNIRGLNDFIIRPGQPPVAISPHDTVVGFKNQMPGFGGGVTLNQTLNINVSNTDHIRREIDDANRRTVESIRRLIKQ